MRNEIGNSETLASEKSTLTSAQQRAVIARGNVLVMAGAGTGKTHTLVARCLDCILREGASLDEILIVTFTEAAAAEMKQRLRAALEKNLDSQNSTSNQFVAEQLALFDTAAHRDIAQFLFQARARTLLRTWPRPAACRVGRR
ncbi:MAG: UvrD-helicase domain-containing protein [Limisphaerales bacterium]